MNNQELLHYAVKELLKKAIDSFWRCKVGTGLNGDHESQEGELFCKDTPEPPTTMMFLRPPERIEILKRFGLQVSAPVVICERRQLLVR